MVVFDAQTVTDCWAVWFGIILGGTRNHVMIVSNEFLPRFLEFSTICFAGVSLVSASL